MHYIIGCSRDWNEFHYITIIKEWLTQSVAVGVGGAGAAAGGGLVLSLKNDAGQ